MTRTRRHLSISTAALAVGLWGCAGAVAQQRHALLAVADAPALAAGPLAAQHGSVRGGGTAVQAYLGVDVRDVGEEEVSALHLRDTRGAEIVRVDHDAPAGSMGLRVRDVILQLNGIAVEAAEPLRRMLHELSPGRAVALLVCREGQTIALSAAMADRAEVEREAWQHHLTQRPAAPAANSAGAEEQAAPDVSAPAPSRYGRSFLGNILPSPSYTGAMLSKLTPQLAGFFGAAEGRGLLVQSVETNSPAQMAGLRAGDIVLRADGHDLRSVNDWTHQLKDAKGHPLALVILRDRQEHTLTLMPDARHHSSLDAPAPAFQPAGEPVSGLPRSNARLEL